MSLPPGILDPAGPFEKCEVCGYDEDYTKAYDHRECSPKIRDIGWYICQTCNRYPWDCSCPAEAECVDCEVSVTDIDGPKCEDSPTGYHRWKVTDGDSWRYLFTEQPRVIALPDNQAFDDEALPY